MKPLFLLLFPSLSLLERWRAGAGGRALPKSPTFSSLPVTFFSTINTGVILFLPPLPFPVLCLSRTGLLVPFDVANLIPLEMDDARNAPTDKPSDASADVIVGAAAAATEGGSELLLLILLLDTLLRRRLVVPPFEEERLLSSSIASCAVDSTSIVSVANAYTMKKHKQIRQRKKDKQTDQERK